MLILNEILIIKGFFMFALYIGFIYYYNYAHEMAHARVYANNKIKYVMKVSLGESSCEGEKETKETIRDHNNIDAIGYHLKVFLDMGFYLFGVAFMCYN